MYKRYIYKERGIKCEKVFVCLYCGLENWRGEMKFWIERGIWFWRIDCCGGND